MPVTAFKDADSMNIRENLLWIKKSNPSVSLPVETEENVENQVEKEIVNNTNNLTTGEQSDPAPLRDTRRKRKHEENEELVETAREKRIRLRDEVKEGWKPFEKNEG